MAPRTSGSLAPANLSKSLLCSAPAPPPEAATITECQSLEHAFAATTTEEKMQPQQPSAFYSAEHLPLGEDGKDCFRWRARFWHLTYSTVAMCQPSCSFRSLLVSLAFARLAILSCMSVAMHKCRMTIHTLHGCGNARPTCMARGSWTLSLMACSCTRTWSTRSRLSGSSTSFSATIMGTKQL